MLTQWAKTAFLSGLDGLTGGTLTVECPDRTYRYGDRGELDATLAVHDERFFLRALTGSDIGLGESFMDGDWTTPDLVPLVRLMLRNRRALEGQRRLTGALHRLAGGFARRLRDNSLAGSRRHIRRHYDLGNDFFRLFLDAELLMYSCGYFESAADTLEQAQVRKADRICRALRLSPTDRVLEIGSGWGGFAVRAATQYGCRVTTTTISDEQYRHVREWKSRIGDVGARIDVLREDYRNLSGRFDKVVSIEMFEAVGLSHYDSTSRSSTACSRRMASCSCRQSPSTIMVPEYHGTRTGLRSTSFRAANWRRSERFSSRWREPRRSRCITPRIADPLRPHAAGVARPLPPQPRAGAALGFDDRFIRMWDLTLGSCEATFLERQTGLFQLMLLKTAPSACSSTSRGLKPPRGRSRGRQ